jgi:hypothetical protein
MKCLLGRSFSKILSGNVYVILVTYKLAHVKRVWWELMTVDMVLILKYLYDITCDTLSIGPQLVNDGSAS